MTSTDESLAVFVGAKTGAEAQAWAALDDDARAAKEQEGIAAWGVEIMPVLPTPGA